MCKYKFYITTSLLRKSKSILEAMGAGCIVIAPKNENNVEIIKMNLMVLYDLESRQFDSIFTQQLSNLIDI